VHRIINDQLQYVNLNAVYQGFRRNDLKTTLIEHASKYIKHTKIMLRMCTIMSYANCNEFVAKMLKPNYAGDLLVKYYNLPDNGSEWECAEVRLTKRPDEARLLKMLVMVYKAGRFEWFMDTIRNRRDHESTVLTSFMDECISYYESTDFKRKVFFCRQEQEFGSQGASEFDAIYNADHLPDHDFMIR